MSRQVFPARTRALSTLLLVGRGHSGKTAIAEYLKRRHGYAEYAFSDPLRDALHALYGVHIAEILSPDKEAPIERLDRSVRELMQRLGDHVRTVLGPRALVDRLVERAIARGDWLGAPIVIRDGRTAAEIDFVRENGGRVWWISRDGGPVVFPYHVPTEDFSNLYLRRFRPGDVSFRFPEGPRGELHAQVDAALEAIVELEKMDARE